MAMGARCRCENEVYDIPPLLYPNIIISKYNIIPPLISYCNLAIWEIPCKYYTIQRY
jgi:hypothetical protein